MRSVSFCVATLLILLASALADERTLNFGVVPTETAINLRKDYEILRLDLEQALGLKVKMFFAPDYTGVIEAMRFDQVQMGLFGNNSAIDAVDRAGAEVFAQTVDKDGQAGYWSLIAVHRDSSINTLEELLARRRELTFAMGDHQSTSGTLVPGYYAFVRSGVNPGKEFKAMRNGNHEANILAVANKQIDACTCSNEAIFRLELRMPEMAKRIKTIWKSPLIASDPLLMRRDLPEELKAKIKAFFASYGQTEAQRKAIESLKWSGFRASNNDQLMPYRLMRVLKDKAQVDADEKLSADDRAAKLQELTQAQRKLEKALPPAGS